MCPENPEGTKIIIGSINMGYISDTARNLRIGTHNLFRPKGSRSHYTTVTEPPMYLPNALVISLAVCQSVSLFACLANRTENDQ